MEQKNFGLNINSGMQKDRTSRMLDTMPWVFGAEHVLNKISEFSREDSR